jgi:hypothetical protein
VRLRVDDDIYRVDGVWLGPPRRTLPWRARYIAYGVGLIVFLLLQVLERRIGVGLSFFPLAYSMLATIVITRAALKAVDHDRGVGSLLMAFGNEVSAPRPGGRSRTATWRPGRVRVSAGRRRRRVRHQRDPEDGSRPAVRHASRRVEPTVAEPATADSTAAEPAARAATVEG